ncbi:MAG: polyprenyl synthetase family protein, partial [Sciscionella sp.]
LQAGVIAAGAGPEPLPALESLGRHLGAAFQITDDLLNLRADPEEYGKEIGGDIWEGKRTLMLLHTLRSAEPTDRDRAVQILSKRRPSADGELGLTELLDRLTARGQLSQSGRGEIEARLQEHHPSESKSLNDIRWVYELMHRVGSLSHAREVATRHAREAAIVLAGLDWLPRSRHRDMLAGLVDYVHGRTR